MKMFTMFAVVLLNGSLWAQTSRQKPVSLTNRLSAGLAIPIKKLAQSTTIGPGGSLLFIFTVTNSTQRTVREPVGDSKLFINGKELKDWSLILRDGPRDSRFLKELPPGQSITIGYNLANYFPAPGNYRVIWKGTDFEAPEVEFKRGASELGSKK
jgi:hypothetical protein